MSGPPIFGYNQGIPAAPNNPSSDQPGMLQNTNSIFGLIGVDHVDFGLTNNGYHEIIHFDTQGSDPTNITGIGQLYTKTVGSSQELYYESGAGFIARLTRCDFSNFSTFATNDEYQPENLPLNEPSVTGGWTFLPGGLLLQYGIATDTTDGDLSTNNVITFPKPFTSFVASVVVTSVRNTTDDKMLSILTGSISKTQFELELSGSRLPTNATWMAIGI